MAAFCTSASARTISADLPPSSSNTFLMVGAAWPRMAAPTPSDPVKVTMSTRASLVSACATSGPPVTMFSTPGGRPISLATSPNSSAENGV